MLVNQGWVRPVLKGLTRGGA